MKIKKVIIVLRLSGASGREILSGIFLYTKKNPGWHTRLFQMPDELTPETYRTLEDEGYDGIIASEAGSEETANLLLHAKTPIAFIGDSGPILSRRTKNICYIRNDDEYIGRQGARFLLSLGKRRAFGFLPTTSKQYWSDIREKGFLDELAEHGSSGCTFKSPSAAGTPSDMTALRQWLIGLPKPCALMAAWDTRATQALQICQENKIKVPEQIAVIGVDNDELLDESATPPLTSIMPNHEKLGFVAARELNKLMSNKKATPFLSRPLKLVERESTANAAPAAHLISRAIDFINKNATKGISVQDVANHLGVSRRLADLRFHEFNGESIAETILHVKLEAVKKMLSTTSRSINNVTIECGFANASYLKTLFRKQFGMTMTAFRETSSS